MGGSEQGPSLRVTEVFFSLQGEARMVGIPTVFVRLTGCPLRCVYCDTAYAFNGGERQGIDDIVARVQSYPTRHVTVTGGEPLAQPACTGLLSVLCDLGYEVSLETSGALPIDEVDSRVSRVMDIKTPSSTESHRNRDENIACLTPRDQIKFVIGDRADYEWARERLVRDALVDRCEVLFSPVHGEQGAAELADWILADGLRVRFQLQLHKLLWGDEPGR